MNISLRFFALLLGGLFSISPAYSAIWDGGGSDNLASTPANWTGNAVPSSGDIIFSNDTSSKDCTWDLNDAYIALAIDGGYAGTLTVDSSSTLTLSGNYVPPDAPSGLNAVAISASRIDLSWTDNSNTEQGFKIERKTGAEGTYTQIGTADADAIAYSDTDASLLPGTTYYYRVGAYDLFADSVYSNEANATTLAIAPTATTNAVSNNAGTTATLNATVNPNGAETSVQFEWGTTTAYGNTTTPQVIPAGTSDVPVTANIIGLSANTSYHYRIVATNSIGTTNGSDEPFTTPIIAPSATTNPVSNNAGSTATLNASVNPNGAETSVYFQWGPDTSYGNTTTTQIIPAGSSPVAVTANISGLVLNTTYHFRVVATNSVGTTYGDDVSFATPSDAPPTAVTTSASNKNGNSATLNGTVNPNGLETSVYFEWGLTASYGDTTSAQPLPAGYDDIVVSANITGLTISTTYHYRVVATNADGTTYGSDMTFTTPPITITITSPTNGSTINRPDIMVTGTLDTPGNETGVTVNGKVAMVYNNTFVVNHVPLSDGANTIPVTATDTVGNTATTAIAVTADTSYPYVTLTANPESGVAPLDTTIRINGSFSVTNPVIEATGPAAVESLVNPTPGEYSYRMTTEGIYFFTATATGPGAIQYQDTAGIVVYNLNQFDSPLRTIWIAMTTKLSTGDNSGALQYMSSITRPVYEQITSEISNQLPSLMATQQELNFIYATGNMAKYELVTLEAGTLYSYEVIFLKDEYGIWKILQY